MALIVRRWPILQLQVVRVQRTIRKRDLIVVRVIERLRQRIRSTQLIPGGKSFLETQQQPVTLRLHTRLEIHNRIGPTHDRIENSTNRATDDEMRAEVEQGIRAHDVIGKLSLNAEVNLLDHR